MRKTAVLTFVRNESVFLPIWLKYYSKYFNGDDIYIMDHSSTDESIQKAKQLYDFHHIRVPFKEYDVTLKTRLVNAKFTELLESYQYVLYADADEIIVANPHKFTDLKECIDATEHEYVTCLGFGIVQQRHEPCIDLSKPILRQRKCWLLEKKSCKTLLSRIPLDWTPGFHLTNTNQPNITGDLWSIHLHKFDYNLAWKKHWEILSWEWNNSIPKIYSWQFRISEKKYFDYYFYHDAGTIIIILKHKLLYIIKTIIMPLVTIIMPFINKNTREQWYLWKYVTFNNYKKMKIPEILISKNLI